MEQKQDEPGTIWKIGRIVKEWQAERMGSEYAMREIKMVLDTDDMRWHRGPDDGERVTYIESLRDRLLGGE